MKIGRDGQMTLGLVVTLTFFFVVGLAILSLRFDLRRQVQNQRRLDQCIQKKVTRLLGTQKKIEWGNLRIEAERLTYEATKLIQPQIAIAARIAMELEVLYQKGLLADWDLTRALWVKDRGCDGKSDFPLPLPSLKWKRFPPDATGPQSLTWIGLKSKPLPFFISNGKRISYAEVTHKSFRWHADWQHWTKSL